MITGPACLLSLFFAPHRRKGTHPSPESSAKNSLVALFCFPRRAYWTPLGAFGGYLRGAASMCPPPRSPQIHPPIESGDLARTPRESGRAKLILADYSRETWVPNRCPPRAISLPCLSITANLTCSAVPFRNNRSIHAFERAEDLRAEGSRSAVRAPATTGAA